MQYIFDLISAATIEIVGVKVTMFIVQSIE